MNALNVSPPAKTFALELDVLRGVAAILMIVNHAGVRLLSPADANMSTSGFSVFLGSFAPSVFFFATGFGIALGTVPQGRRPAWRPVFWKAGLLVVADQFFFWRQGLPAGLDFFSFIAISTVLVTVLAGLRQSVAACLALIVLILAIRYGVGPIVRARAPDAGLLATWLVGAKPIANVSYPFSPWMVYPLLGFVLGMRYRVDAAQSGPRIEWLVPGALFTLGVLGAAVWAWSMGMEFFRWGTMNAAFFLLSLGVLSACGLSSIRAALAHQRVASAVALRGVASFAVIPLHYLMLDTCVALLPIPMGPLPFAALTILLIVASFWLANGFAAVISRPMLNAHRHTTIAALLMTVAILAVATLMSAPQSILVLAITVPAAQLAVAGTLALRAARVAPSP